MIKCVIDDVQDVIAQIYDEDNRIRYYQFPYGDEDQMIVTDGIRIVIPGLDLSIRQGDVCVYDADEDCYMADFSITLIYDLNEKDPTKYLFWEQDTPAVALYNYLYHNNVTMDRIESSECEIEIELEE